MSSHCLKCENTTGNINPRVLKTSNNRTVLSSKCAIYGRKKSKFIKNKK